MKKSLFKLISSILLSIIALIIFTQGIYQLSSKAKAEQKTSLEASIWRSITECYVMEGRYPENLEYLKDEYGLSYDSESFFVGYQVIGQNIVPEVVIMEK